MSATSRESAAAERHPVGWAPPTIAAERRQIVAHGVSHGSSANATKAPEGRQNLSPLRGFLHSRRFIPHLAPWAMSAVLLTGCGAPNSANIELRKENQTLHDQ